MQKKAQYSSTERHFNFQVRRYKHFRIEFIFIKKFSNEIALLTFFPLCMLIRFANLFTIVGRKGTCSPSSGFLHGGLLLRLQLNYEVRKLS